MSVLNNSLLLGQEGGAGYVVQRSVRFNASDSAYLSRTPASAGNRKTWTWAGWVKKSKITSGDYQFIFGAIDSGATAYTALLYSISDDALSIWDNQAGTPVLRTSQVFRDASAWFHVVWSVDTTQSTASNRMKLYVNGSEVTAWATDARSSITQNLDLAVNRGSWPHSIGSQQPYAGRYFDGYLADIHFIDGQALTPSSFTEVSATTGQLIPKAYTGSYGTNGFRLTFSDNSGTTSTTLGKDAAGSNNWTPNNFSVASGSGNDSLVDTPTSYGTDTGAGNEVRGNYATWNPLISSTNLTNGNLSVVQPSTTGASRYSTLGMSTGKWYWEISVVKYSNTVFGIRTPGGGTLETPYDSSGYGMGWRTAGGFFIGGSNTGTGSMSLAAGDVLGLAFDADAGTLKFYKNGTLNNTLTASSTYIGQTWFAGSQDSGGGNSDHDVNFGQRSWAYAPPSGHKALCDTNLPSPLIAKPSTAFDVKLYTGNGSTQTISGLGFSPDLVWMKVRSTAYNHTLIDSVRGATKTLSSSMTVQEYTEPTGPTAFTSDGWSMSGDVTYVGSVNANGQTYAAWCWDAGTSTVTNTQGSITSQVRANASAGFSIVTWTGNGANNQSVGHGLNVAPSLIVIKCRSASTSWHTYVRALDSTGRYQLYLNSTSGSVDFGAPFFDGSSSLINLYGGASVGINGSGSTYVAYAFSPVAGYSSFGSYTGNGSTDGPFVYTGFRPRWLLIKNASSAVDWELVDTARDTSNGPQNNRLQPNASAAEAAGYTVFDTLSNGFKVRSSTSNWNGSTNTVIYAAFAENPFQYARAR